MARPWEDTEDDPDESKLVAAEVTFTTWIEISCETILSPHVNCDFQWFSGDGQLNDSVESGTPTTWDVLDPGEATTSDTAQKESGEDKPSIFRARFSKDSPTIQARCDFVRKLPELSLQFRMRFPASLDDVRAPPSAGSQPPVEAKPSKAPAKGKAEEPAKPAFEETSFDIPIPLAPFTILGYCGGAPETEEDCMDAAKSAKCEGLFSLRVGLRANVPVASEQIAQYLNPLLLTVNGVHRLPQEQNMGQTRDSVHAILNAFGTRKTTMTRSLDSNGGASFGTHAVFFVGRWHQRKLREYLQIESLGLELHDRDAAAPEQKPYGIGRFSIADLLGPFSKKIRTLRSVVEPYFPCDERHASNNLLDMAKFFEPGAKELLDSYGAKKFESVPRYVEHGSYVKVSFGVAHPIRALPRYKVPGSAPPAPAETAPQVEPKAKAKADPKDKKAKSKSKPSTPSTPAKPQEEAAAKEKESETAPPVDPEAGRHDLYARLVLVTDYRRTTMMKRLLALVREVNAKALQLDESQSKTIASVQLTDAQMADKTLDIVTGFCVMDRSSRVSVVEGLRDGAINRVIEVLEAGSQKASAKCKILHHPDVGFSQRLYGVFNLCMKQIKLRQRHLERLMHRPDLYDRAREDKEVVHALQCLMEMKRATRLHVLKAADAFPSAQGILTVETQYGDFVADEELEGGRVMDDSRSQTSASKASKAESKVPTGSDSKGLAASRAQSRLSGRTSPADGSQRTRQEQAADDELEEPDEDESELLREEEVPSRPPKVIWKPPTDSSNVAFLRALKEREKREPSDMIDRNKTKLGEFSQELAKTRPPKKVPDQAFLDGVEVHIYSTQTLNSAELQKKALRAKLEARQALEFGCYSAQFNSGCFPMLEKDIDLKNLLREPTDYKDDREPWRWPKARDKSEYKKPDRTVSDSRKEDLACPWVENELRPDLEGKEVIKGAFDMKTLGTGGAHVIPTRRPGLREPFQPPPPPKVEPKEPMRYVSGFASMGMPAPVDKYNKSILEGKPQRFGFCFEKRTVPKAIMKKFGPGNPISNVEAPPVSFNNSEDFQEPDKGNSEYPHQFSAMLARPVVTHALGDKGKTAGRTINFKSPSDSATSTTANWNKTVVKDGHSQHVNIPPKGNDNMLSTATGPLSARGSAENTRKVRPETHAIPMSAR